MLLRPVGGTNERWSLDRPKHRASSNDWQAGEVGCAKRALDGKPPKEVVVVPQRIVNVLA